MSHFLKPTKSKVKLLLFFLFILFLFSLLSVFAVSAITKTSGPDRFPEQINIFNKFFGVLSSFFVPYAIFIFLKKNFSLKKDFTGFSKIFFIVYAARELVGIIPILIYKIFPGVIFSNPAQIAGVGLQFIIYYIAICFIDKINIKK